MNSKYFHIVLAIGILVIGRAGFGESYPNRPTAAGLGEIIAEGIICGKAVQERGGGGLPYCGHGQSYFAVLQQSLENVAPMYIDSENGPLTEEGDDFLYFDLATWRAAACLNASGFRRFTGSNWTYGVMQPNDVIGAWIFEELHDGCGVLKWRQGSLSWPNNSFGLVWKYYGGTWEGTKIYIEFFWGGGGTDYAAPEAATWAARLYPGGVYTYEAEMVRSQATPKVNNIATIPHILVLYVRGVQNREATNYTYDDNGDGITEGPLYIKESSGVETNTSWTGTIIGQVNTNMPNWCDEPEQQGTSKGRGYTCIAEALLQYIFTNE